MAKAFKVKKVAPDTPAPAAARRVLRTRLREFYSHWPDPDSAPAPVEIHNMRISGKRLRYSADSLRTLYPDQPALLLDLLKKQQDLLGAFQDCVTQRAAVEAEIASRRRRGAPPPEVAALEGLTAAYDERQAQLFTNLTYIWRGMMGRKFRASLKDMISNFKPGV